jgi:hypothetical protein
MLSDLQRIEFERIRKAICDSVSFYDVAKGAISVTTPFLDWKGAPTEVYITSDGIVTDGGRTISQLMSLRVKEEFDSWPYLKDYLSKFCIDFDGKRMDMIGNDDEECYLRFIQGVSRLPRFFEPKPITTAPDNFPNDVKGLVMEAVRSEYRDDPERGNEVAAEITRPRRITLRRKSYHIISDLSPRRHNRMVLIISHAARETSEQNQHVASKVLWPVLWRRERKDVEPFSVVGDISNYTDEAAGMMRDETYVIQMKDEGAKKRLMEVLIEP